jgi:squalene-hopene/tetraprenyl-beta-curcumene cyclase
MWQRAGVGLVVAIGIFVSAADTPKVGPDPKEWTKAVEAGVTYLKSAQAADGTWGGPVAPGLTGIVALGLLRSGQAGPDDPAVAKALKYIESLVDDAGHIAGKGAKVGGHNYATAVNVMALAAADKEGKYKAIVDKASAYLRKLQWDEDEEKSSKDWVYGGAGYGGGSRPDLSNTQFFLDALKAAGVPPTDPAFKKALLFVSRCQNLKSEYNDQPWADKINDGSFIYAASGDTRGATTDDGLKPGYGSMTWAGLKSLVMCGVGKDDPRYKKALEWLSKNYTVDGNPGMPAGNAGRGHYYYLLTMARALDTLGVDHVTDAAGKKHDWRAEVTAALVARQRKNGQWINETDRWMEGSPELCSAYAVITLSYTKPK